MKDFLQQAKKTMTNIKIEYNGKSHDLEISDETSLEEAIREILAENPAPESFRDIMKDGSFGPEVVSIPEGTFTMGSDDSDCEDEKPEHQVDVQSFSAGKYPVTFEEYDKFCEDTGRIKPNDRGWGRGRRPAINVSWDDAKAYCAWLSEQTGETYRLLTEEEWEYACKAGDERGGELTEDELGQVAWYGGNSEMKTHEVGQKKPNAFGLYDMLGNVWEWVEDCYQPDWYKAKGDQE